MVNLHTGTLIHFLTTPIKLTRFRLVTERKITKYYLNLLVYFSHMIKEIIHIQGIDEISIGMTPLKVPLHFAHLTLYQRGHPDGYNLPILSSQGNVNLTNTNTSN